MAITMIEELHLSGEEEAAYDLTKTLLQRAAKFLAPIPAVVSLRDIVTEPPEAEEQATSLLTPNKGHHALFQALEKLEGLEKEEQTLLEHNPLTTPLTQVVVVSANPTIINNNSNKSLSDGGSANRKQRGTNTNISGGGRQCVYISDNINSDNNSPQNFVQIRTAREALNALHDFGSIPRRVCQHPFKRNDIVWVCRTCQADETCVLCHTCFSQSSHEGHDVAFYHAQAGGCCDCGDPDAWDPAGFCPHHGPQSSSAIENSTNNLLSPGVVRRVRGVVPATVDWMVHVIANNAEAAYQRVMRYRKDHKAVKTSLRKSSSMSASTADADAPSVARAATATAALPQQHPQQQQQQQQQHHQHLPTNRTLSSHEDDHHGSDHDDNDQLMSLEGHVFSPMAASMSKSHSHYSSSNISTGQLSLAEELGNLGREGHGLYLVLQADDIHSPPQWVDALREFLGASSYYTDSLLAKFVRALRQYGQLVVWGTMELVAECGATQVQLWLDGDKVASARIGAVLLDRANRLVKNGFFCSIVTREELKLEQRAVAVLQWMSALARSCDPLCQTVAECILPNRHLVPLLRADFKLSARITKAWYSLLLTLLAVPTFKSHLAAAYCDTYRSVTAKYAHGMGVLERSAYTLSVQFLNRVTYVVDLVEGRDLLGKLGKSLLETLEVAKSQNLSGRLNPNHFVLSHRRYSPCISDLKCVLNVKGMKRLFASQQGTFLQDWVSALSLAQFMDAQVWRHWSQDHVQDEVRGWVGAFNLSISLGSLFERLLSWEDDEISPIRDPQSPLSRNLMTCVELTYHLLVTGITRWQRAEMLFCQPTLYSAAVDPYKRAPASLPFSTVAATRHGCVLAMRQMPVAQVTPFSFHLPLHRFVAACLREVCLRRSNKQQIGMEELLHQLSFRLSNEIRDELFRGLMEFPVLVLARAAQVRAGLWRRNGPGLNDQVLNYAEPPFCRSMRDADLLLIQFAVLGRTLHQSPSSQNRPTSDVGISFLVNLLLHRFGIFDFAGMTKAINTNINRYVEEANEGYYPRELTQDGIVDGGGCSLVLPWTYSPARDASTFLVLVEEFLHLIIIFTSELPPMPPTDKNDHTNQAKWRLRREVVHRLASGPKTHSELSEVHLVLSHWDNVFLSEEGKLVNPDDATGAALGAVLAEVADRKSSRGKLEPDKWELRTKAWESYDPSFFHISLRNHQTAAEGRPQPSEDKKKKNPFGQEPRPYAPESPPVHPVFERLRRDVTADATVLALTYRILHLHCRANKRKNLTDLRAGKLAYESDERSETALARAVHLLCLGTYAWEDAKSDKKNWRLDGGGSAGGIFYDRSDSIPAPTVKDWIANALLANPKELLDCDWYEEEEPALVLLRRLAVDGGASGIFVAQDPAVRSGAAWLCEFAVKHSPAAASLIGGGSSPDEGTKDGDNAESEIEKRKRIAKEKALARMKAEAAKFASMMEAEFGDGEEEGAAAADPSGSSGGATGGGASGVGDSEMQQQPETPQMPISRHGSIGSASGRSLSSGISVDSTRGVPQVLSLSPADSMQESVVDEGSTIPPRLLNVRPQCIICSDDGSRAMSGVSYEEGHRKSRRRKMDGGNALGFVGYAQASTVLKGGGGPPNAIDSDSPMADVRRFVGSHIALCGHAVHSECCESYLATVSHREDRVIGKRDEFRCPLCQRLSNCLVPFIDVGVDWINEPRCLPVPSSGSISNFNAKSEDGSEMDCDEIVLSKDVEGNGEGEGEGEGEGDGDAASQTLSLHDFVTHTPWWVCRNNTNVMWDGQSAFIGNNLQPTGDHEGNHSTHQSSSHALTAASTSSSYSKPRKMSVRSLRKKDLYAAWNAMMKTPRFVRRKFRPRGGFGDDPISSRIHGTDLTSYASDSEESSGETVVWRRFMDQVCDIAYRADSKRLGDENLHNDFGEFRHYIVEKYSYNMSKMFAGNESADWPSCVFSSPISETQRQELSREKLLSKLLMTIQSFTYSCCCESSEARRIVRKHTATSLEVAGSTAPDTGNLASVYSKFGISGVICDGKLILMPTPSSSDDAGTQPFNGRIGKLRYLGLAVMAATGAVSADLLQLVLPFPNNGSIEKSMDHNSMDIEKPDRAPIAYPILFGHVLTHVVAAMCATCGRARARSDSLDLVWQIPFSSKGGWASEDVTAGRPKVESVVGDCEGFLKLGILARILQVLLGRMQVSPCGLDNAAVVLDALRDELRKDDESSLSHIESSWMHACFSLLEAALANQISFAGARPSAPSQLDRNVIEFFRDACGAAASAACTFLADAGTILQILVPGVMGRYDVSSVDMTVANERSTSLRTFEKLRNLLKIDTISEMLQSPLVREIVANWNDTACNHAKATLQPEVSILRSGTISVSGARKSFRGRIYQTQGFRAYDWPMESSLDFSSRKSKERFGRQGRRKMASLKDAGDDSAEDEPQYEAPMTPMQIEAIPSASVSDTPTAELLRQEASPTLVTFSSKKTVPLIGGYSLDVSMKNNGRPRVAVIPTSYTDLYAELGVLLPDCEQTAVCLICGEVLNAGGKGECTRHSYKCGAGMGLFFLLQECAGLIMHKGKAAYIHSPYVDSHGETPQYRGRPLNLDLHRYDHLREVWCGHAVRQQVLAERGSSRQVIVPEFY